MKKRYSIEQIIRVLKQVEGGAGLGEVCREHNISEQTYYRWKRKYGGMEQSEARRLRDREEETGRPKRLVANKALEIRISKEVTQKSGKPHATQTGRGP